jgi:coenzyme F420-0:L-glutamate ligase/coenzyme F420-1:gamma-L-glutamate ligase
VPVCFAFDGSAFYTAVDRKPKRVAAQKLARLRNIRASSKVALLVDEYKEDWSRLWYILVRGRAQQLPASALAERGKAIRLLRKKYSQYAGGMLLDNAPVIRITPERIIFWGKS